MYRLPRIQRSLTAKHLLFTVDTLDLEQCTVYERGSGTLQEIFPKLFGYGPLKGQELQL